jgi:hypothetical protein
MYLVFHAAFHAHSRSGVYYKILKDSEPQTYYMRSFRGLKIIVPWQEVSPQVDRLFHRIMICRGVSLTWFPELRRRRSIDLLCVSYLYLCNNVLISWAYLAACIAHSRTYSTALTTGDPRSDIIECSACLSLPSKSVSAWAVRSETARATDAISGPPF